MYESLANKGVNPNNIVSFAYMGYQNDSYCTPYLNKLCTDFNCTHDYLPGFKVDYTGNDVSPQNIIGVLTGDKSNLSGGSGRVLERLI